MPSPAGIFKKIKNIAKQIGDGAAKAFAWANTNLIQPLKPILSNVIDMFDESGLGSRIFNSVSDGYDHYLEQTNQKPQDGFSQVTNFGKDLFEYTQNSDRYKRPKRSYNKAFDSAKELNTDDW